MTKPKSGNFPHTQEVICPACGASATVSQSASWATPIGNCQCGKGLTVFFDYLTFKDIVEVGSFIPIEPYQAAEVSSMTDVEKLKVINDYLEDETLNNRAHAMHDIRAHILMVGDCKTGKELLDQQMTLTSMWIDLQVLKKCEQMALHILGIIKGQED